MISPTKMTVLLLQEDALQARIWDKILSSQGMTVLRQFPQANLRNLLLDWEQNQIPLPRLLLIELGQASFNAIIFSQWCKERYPDIYLVFLLVDDTPSSLELKLSLENLFPESEKESGLIDCFFPFPRDNLAITTLNALKRIFSRFNPPLKIQNQTFASALITLNRELESTPPASLPLSSPTKIQRISEAPIPHPPRKYRGQSY